MPFVNFNFKKDFEEIVKAGLSPAQFKLLNELFRKHNVDEDQLYYIMHKHQEALGFNIGDRVLYVGYTHLRPNQTEFDVYEVVSIHLDCLTDISIKPVNGGESKRVYHSDLIKIEQ